MFECIRRNLDPMAQLVQCLSSSYAVESESLGDRMPLNCGLCYGVEGDDDLERGGSYTKRLSST
jgi:hypothetical protein